jgi:hypothetical protein
MELQARLDKIAAENQNKEYARMVRSVVGSEQDKVAFKIPHDEMQEIRGHVTAIMNILFSIVACFGAFYKMSSALTYDEGAVSSGFSRLKVAETYTHQCKFIYVRLSVC